MKNGEVDVIKTELAQWSSLVDANTSLLQVFGSPVIAFEQKRKVLDDLIDKTRPSKTAGNFLRVLLKNGRLTEITPIYQRFVQEISKRSDVVAADVFSARELPSGEKDDLRSKLEMVTGKTVNMSFHVDPELIGGVVARIGSTVFDGSVRTKLEALKEQLAGV